MLVFIHSIPRKSETGLSEWTNPNSGRSLKKTKVGRCTTAISASFSPKIGALTNYISYTPWVDDETGLVKTEDGRELTLQDKYERKFNKPKGYFSNRAWEKGNSLAPEDLTYFQKKTWRLNDGTTVLDLTKMDDLMGYYVILASPHVANSESEWKAHKWPKASFYIAIENESEQIKFKKNHRKSEAFAKLHSDVMTAMTKRKMLVILDAISAKARPTEEQIHNILFNYIDSSDYSPTSNINKFNALYKLLFDAKSKELFDAKYYLKAAVDHRIITNKHEIYTWPRSKGTIELGARYDDAIDFMINPKKDKEVEELRSLVDQANLQ